MRQSAVAPSILAAIACAWVYYAVTRYGIWDEGPGGGFMPLLAGLITVGFSLAALVMIRTPDKPWRKTVFIPVCVVIALMLATPYLGMLPCLFLLLVVWLGVLERYSWPFTAVTAACVTGCVWLIFSFWLKVPFPQGMWA